MKSLLSVNAIVLFAICFFMEHTGSAAQSAKDIDPDIPAYEKTDGVSGRIVTVGSDTMENLMILWCDGFRKYNPGVECEITGEGSSTAAPALIEGTSKIGPMSRKMTREEISNFRDKFGYDPKEIKAAIDTIAIYVNEKNPVECLTGEQIDAVFSKNLRCGENKQIKVWGELGIEGDLADKPINLFGRNHTSGTYAYFKKIALCEGDYKDSVARLQSSGAVVKNVSEDTTGIGYAGIGFKTAGVKPIGIKDSSGKCTMPGTSTPQESSYPLGRYLYLYVNESPDAHEGETYLEFIKYVLSKEGQQTVVDRGYVPLDAETVLKMRESLEVNTQLP